MFKLIRGLSLLALVAATSLREQKSLLAKDAKDMILSKETASKSKETASKVQFKMESKENKVELSHTNFNLKTDKEAKALFDKAYEIATKEHLEKMKFQETSAKVVDKVTNMASFKPVAKISECLFMNGAYNSAFGNDHPLESWSCELCESIKSFNFDTLPTSEGWTDGSMETAFYQAALDTFKKNGVIFAYGESNTILANACQKSGNCDVQWFAMGGAFRGQILYDVISIVAAKQKGDPLFETYTSDLRSSMTKFLVDASTVFKSSKSQKWIDVVKIFLPLEFDVNSIIDGTGNDVAVEKLMELFDKLTSDPRVFTVPLQHMFPSAVISDNIEDFVSSPMFSYLSTSSSTARNGKAGSDGKSYTDALATTVATKNLLLGNLCGSITPKLHCDYEIGGDIGFDCFEASESFRMFDAIIKIVSVNDAVKNNYFGDQDFFKDFMGSDGMTEVLSCARFNNKGTDNWLGTQGKAYVVHGFEGEFEEPFVIVDNDRFELYGKYLSSQAAYNWAQNMLEMTLQKQNVDKTIIFSDDFHKLTSKKTGIQYRTGTPILDGGARISNEYDKYVGEDFMGNDITYQDVPFDQCPAICDRTPSCSAYVTNNDKNKGCWFKNWAGNGNPNAHLDAFISRWHCQGGNCMYAVDRDGKGSYAAMLIGNTVISSSFFNGNQAGGIYEVSYDFATAVGPEGGPPQSDQSNSGLVLSINDANGNLVWNGNSPMKSPVRVWGQDHGFTRASFVYAASGNGGQNDKVRFKMASANPGDNRFAGSIDEINIRELDPKVDSLNYKDFNTPFNDDGGGNMVYLDRHYIAADPGWALTKFHYQRNPQGNQFKYDASQVQVLKDAPLIRYVKVKSGDNQYLNIAEVQIFDLAGNILKYTATASSVSNWNSAGWTISNLYDGNTNNYLESMGYINNWVLLDLGSEVQISKVFVFARADCCQDRLVNGYVSFMKADKSEYSRSVMATLQQKYTFYPHGAVQYYTSGLQGDGGGYSGNFAGHNVQCPANSVLSSWHLQRNGGSYEIQYTCTDLGYSSPTIQMNTGRNDWGNGNSIYFDRHTVQCPAYYALKGFKLDYGWDDHRMQFNYVCQALRSPSSKGVSTGTLARFVKVQGPANQYLNIGEVEVFDTENRRIPVQTITSSSLWSTDNPLTQLIDGSYLSWAATFAQPSNWFLLDLGKEIGIGRVVMTNRLDCCADRIVGGSVSLLLSDTTTVVQSFKIPSQFTTYTFTMEQVNNNGN